MKKISYFTILLSAILFVTNLAAQEVLFMDEVVVTASRIKETKQDLTTSVDIIDQNEIKTSSSKNLGQLLTQKGMGHTHQYPGSSTAIGIRGFRTATLGSDLKGHVLILINNRRSGTGNLAKIDINNIERIEIIRGPASAKYGAAAMGGVINVITKQGKGKPSFSVEQNFGSYTFKESLINFSGGYEDKFTNYFDFSTSFSKSSINDYKTHVKEKYYNTGFDDKTNYSLNLGYSFLSDNHRIGIITNSYDSDKIGNPGTIEKNDLDNYFQSSNTSYELNYNKSAKLLSWDLKYFKTKDKNLWVSPVQSNASGWDTEIPYKSDVDQSGIQAQLSLNINDNILTTGVDKIKYETQDGNVTIIPDLRLSEYKTLGMFLIGKLKLIDKKLILSSGLRHDRYDLSYQNDNNDKKTDNNANNTNYFLGAAYPILKTLKIRANYGQAFIMPDAKEFTADYYAQNWDGTTSHFVGNPNLKPEQSQTYELGIDFSNKILNSSLTYFLTNWENRLNSITLENGNKSWRNSEGDSKISGIEGNLSYKKLLIFQDKYNISPFINFTYNIDYDEDFDNDGVKEKIKYVERQNASYGLVFLDAKDFNNLNARLTFAYTGKQEIEDYQDDGSIIILEKNDFTIGNFKITKRLLKSKHGSLSIMGTINNIFNRDYSYVKDYPMPKRSYYFGMRYDF